MPQQLSSEVKDTKNKLYYKIVFSRRLRLSKKSCIPNCIRLEGIVSKLRMSENLKNS